MFFGARADLSLSTTMCTKNNFSSATDWLLTCLTICTNQTEALIIPCTIWFLRTYTQIN